jgi:hypothetical protein
MFDTQLSDFQNFDYDSVIFYKPETINLSDSQNVFRKIKICVKNRDGTFGDLVFSAPKNLFSFGIQELRDSHGSVSGYIMPISLWRKKEPTPEETNFIRVLQDIIDMSHDQVHKYISEDVDTKRFSPLSFKKTDESLGEEKKSPILYTKLIYNKKDQKISTLFIDENSNLEVSPVGILNKKCYVTGAIKIESIFLGDKVTLQIKLYEAIVRVMKQGKRLLNNDMRRKRSDAPLVPVLQPLNVAVASSSSTPPPSEQNENVEEI